MARVNPWTVRLHELVASGPVPFNKAVSEMMALVPPGQGYRKGVWMLDWSRRNAKGGGPQRQLPAEEEKSVLIRTGRRAIATSAIWTQTKHNRVEVFEDDGERWLRVGTNPPGATFISLGERGRPRPALTRISPWTKHIWRRVAEGDVPIETLRQECFDMIPDDLAIRNVTQASASQKRRFGRSRKGSPTDPSSIAVGKRRIFATALNALVKRNRVTLVGADQQIVSRGSDFWTAPPPEA